MQIIALMRYLILSVCQTTHHARQFISALWMLNDTHTHTRRHTTTHSHTETPRTHRCGIVTACISMSICTQIHAEDRFNFQTYQSIEVHAYRSIEVHAYQSIEVHTYRSIER